MTLLEENEAFFKGDPAKKLAICLSIAQIAGRGASTALSALGGFEQSGFLKNDAERRIEIYKRFVRLGAGYERAVLYGIMRLNAAGFFSVDLEERVKLVEQSYLAIREFCRPCVEAAFFALWVLAAEGFFNDSPERRFQLVVNEFRVLVGRFGDDANPILENFGGRPSGQVANDADPEAALPRVLRSLCDGSAT